MPVLFDQFGREIRVEKKPDTREIAAVAVRDRWSSYPSKGLTPKRLADIFRAADAGDVYRQAELYEEMEEKDAHLSSQLQTRKNAVLGLDYDVQAYSDSAEDKKIAEFCADALFALEDLEEALLDLLDAIGKGFSLAELNWSVESGKALLSGINWIHQKRAVLTEYGAQMWAKDFQAPRILTETEPSRGEVLPPFKLVYHRYKARSGYDTRAGVLRVCSWMYLFKNYGIKDWVSFAEVFGMPIRLGKYEQGATKEDKDALVAAISSIGTDAAGIISKATEIEFVETVKASTKDNVFKTLADFCDAQMSKAILGQTLTSEAGDRGSYALGKVHDNVRHDLIQADAEALAKTVRFQIIRPLVGYNFGWDKPLPWFQLKFEEPEDLKEISEVYKNIQAMGYPLTAEHISARFKVPLPEKGQTVLEAARPGFMGQAMKRIPAALKKDPGARFDADQEELEELAADAVQQAARAWQSIDEPVKKLIASSASLEELKDKLFDVYADMDPADLENLVRDALITAALAGAADAARPRQKKSR